MNAGRLYLGIDVGGTKLAAGVITDEGAVVASRRVTTPHGVAVRAEEVWQALVSLVHGLLADAGVGQADLVGVGVGCGGPLLWPVGLVSPLNLSAWRGFPLRDRVVEWLPGRPVRLHNDAVCFAVAEHWRGAARGSASALGIVVSTGVGGGLVLGGRVADGPTGNAGHVGHVIVEPDGPACGCGSHGCLEAVARGPAIARWAVEHGWPAGSRAVTAEAVAAAAREGQPVALAAFERAGRALGRAIASATNLLDLDVVVIGGGVAETGALLFEPMTAELDDRLTMDFASRLTVVPAALGRDAGLIGAAALLAAGDLYWSQG